MCLSGVYIGWGGLFLGYCLLCFPLYVFVLSGVYIGVFLLLGGVLHSNIGGVSVRGWG